jgi:4-amino-4-deoxy-L-arabinose transferase-like glycosyltransferase
MENQELEQRKEKIKDFVKENIVIIAMMSLVTIVYLYYFFKLGNQPIWWDEGDYLSIAKILAINMPRPEWWASIISARPLIIPLVWAGLMKIGFGELALRFFTELLPALGTIFLTYVLGKELFNKKIGLIAVSIISFNWIFMFFTFRLLTDLPSAFFGISALTLFWVGYEKRKNKWGLWLAIVAGVLSFLIRYPAVFILISIAIYLLITRGLDLFKDKNIWIAGIIGLLCLSPLFLFNYSNQGHIFPAISQYHGDTATSSIHYDIGWQTVTQVLPAFLTFIPLILFIIGLIISMQFFLYLDLILAKNKKQGRNYLYLFIISVIFPLYLIFGIRVAEARYYIIFSPSLFICIALAISFIGDKIKPFLPDKKYLNLLLIFFCAFIMYNQLGYANSFIMNKFGSYGEVQEAGLWLKENTPKDAKIITASTRQNQYYSERISYDFATDTGHNETEFNEFIKELEPDYMIIHVFEPAFTPQWAYDYPQRNNLTLVAGFGPQNQPRAIIYKFNY